MRDLAAIVEREVATAQLAIADPLTGLNNRRGFFMHAEQLARVCERHQVPLTIAYFDLDHFKAINDQFGHDVGDEILREFAQVLERQVRESDVVARVGGDEFVALLTHATEGSDAGDRISQTFIDLTLGKLQAPRVDPAGRLRGAPCVDRIGRHRHLGAGRRPPGDDGRRALRRRAVRLDPRAGGDRRADRGRGGDHRGDLRLRDPDALSESVRDTGGVLDRRNADSVGG